MNLYTACQLNYVISVAYGNMEYKNNLENVENKWYNTVKVFVYRVTDMNKEKIFSDSREKLTDINKIKVLENNNKSSEEEILNYFKELSKYVKIVDEKTGEKRY